MPKDRGFAGAQLLYRMRDEIRASAGKEYREMIKPVMELVRKEAQNNGTSVLKAFQLLVTPYLDKDHRAEVFLLGAAVVELYELRERLLPGIGRG